MLKLFSCSKNRSNCRFDSSDIEVIGVGCGGINVVNHMQMHGFKEVSLAVCDMDASVIHNSKVQEKLLLGSDGLGAGNKPELGQKEAEKKISDIQTLIKKQTKVTFVVTCLGGGCGTGVAPIIARESKKRGIKTIGVATLPFEFEGKIKFSQAIEGIRELAANTDSMFVLNNQYILKHHPELAMNNAFSKADELIGDVVWSIIGNMSKYYGTKPHKRIRDYIKRLFTRTS